MAEVKLTLIYPRPTDEARFEQAYLGEHLPQGAQVLPARTAVRLTRVLGSPDGPAAVHRITDIAFPSLEALQTWVATPAAQALVADATRLSTGGPPTILICEESGLTT